MAAGGAFLARGFRTPPRSSTAMMVCPPRAGVSTPLPLVGQKLRSHKRRFFITLSRLRLRRSGAALFARIRAGAPAPRSALRGAPAPPPGCPLLPLVVAPAKCCWLRDSGAPYGRAFFSATASRHPDASGAGAPMRQGGRSAYASRPPYRLPGRFAPFAYRGACWRARSTARFIFILQIARFLSSKGILGRFPK